MRPCGSLPCAPNWLGLCGAVRLRGCWQRDNPEDEIRLKILQTLPLLLTPTAYVISPMFVSLAVDMCFHFLQDKSPVIQHTAEATVRQVGGWVGVRWGQPEQEVFLVRRATRLCLLLLSLQAVMP
jgi:hypothetical protein